MINHLGYSMSFASNDMKERSNQIKVNRDLMVDELKLLKPNSDEAKYLIPFTIFEMKKKYHDFNQVKKNKWQIKKHILKDQVQPWMKDYLSTSRILPRTQWMLSFSEKILY